MLKRIFKNIDKAKNLANETYSNNEASNEIKKTQNDQMEKINEDGLEVEKKIEQPKDFKIFLEKVIIFFKEKLIFKKIN